MNLKKCKPWDCMSSWRDGDIDIWGCWPEEPEEPGGGVPDPDTSDVAKPG